VDSASESEVHLIQPAVDDIPPLLLDLVITPLIADRAYDSDPLRESLYDEGFELLSPHRLNRKKAATNDGRKMRRYSRRWIVERTISWFHSYRRAITRYERYSHIHDGFVRLATAFICLNRLVK
jgi:transposase